MSSRSKGFPWFFTAALVVVGCLFIDLTFGAGRIRAVWLQSQGGGCAAEVDGQVITRLDLEAALREHLWTHHQAWDVLDAEKRGELRQQVLQSMIDDRLVRAARLAEGTSGAAPAEVRREAEMMRRQFAQAEDYPPRLAAQGHTQQSWDAAIRDAQLDERWLTKKMAPHLTEVIAGEARAWFEQHQETLRIPQAHHAAHIFLTRNGRTESEGESEMRKIHRQLSAQEKNFAALAAQHSEDERTKTLGGDLGWFARDRMPADFMDGVEKLRIGQFSAPVATKLGWHIILVMERRESRLPTFAEAQEEVLPLLTHRKREEALQNLLGELRQRARPTTKYHTEVIDRAVPAS